MVQNWDNITMEILLLLLRGENHLRNIARELNMSHSTVQRKLLELVKEQIVESKTEGKNKIFWIKKNMIAKTSVYAAEQYKVMKLFQQYPELSIITEDILKKTSQHMVILFGSYAKSIAKKESDIDIYIDTTSKKMKEEVENINSKIRVKIGEFDTSSLLIKEIVKNHIIFKGVEEFYAKTKFFE